MEHINRLALFSPLDFVAVALLILTWVISGWWIERTDARRLSFSILMAEYRREWMRQFITRQPRIFDSNVIASLRQGTSFLASASMLAIGGGLALMGNQDRLIGVAEDLTLARVPPFVWEAKILLVILFVTNAFLKFVWAHRLFGYCAIIMAAVPNDPDDPRAGKVAAQAAEINITAAKGFNRGLRAIYFSLGALAWLIGPVALILATVATFGVVWRREYGSRSREVIAG